MNKWMAFIFLLCMAGLFAPFFKMRDAQFYIERGYQNSVARSNHGWMSRWNSGNAMDDFNRAIKLNPKSAAAYAGRAGLEFANQNYDAAIKDYTTAIELNPQDVNSYIARANIEAIQHDYKQALDDYDKVIQIADDNRAAYRGRITVMEMQSNFTGVVTERIRMIEESGRPFFGALTTNEQFFTNRGPGSGRRRAPLSALLDRALDADTDFAWGYYYRGVIKSVTDDKQEALADFQQCRNFPDEKLKDYAAIHIWLVQMQAGETEKAAQELQNHFNRRTNASSDWQMNIAKFLLNEISEEKFFKTIDASDAGRQQSEFWYYAGMKHLLAGDKTGANECFQKTTITKKRSFASYVSAAMELRALGGLNGNQSIR